MTHRLYYTKENGHSIQLMHIHSICSFFIFLDLEPNHFDVYYFTVLLVIKLTNLSATVSICYFKQSLQEAWNIKFKLHG